MSRFDDLEGHLRREGALREQGKETLRRNVELFLKEFDPLLVSTGEVLEEYYTTIKPHTDLILIPKKDEKEIDLTSSNDSHLVIVGNLIHQTNFPYPSGSNEAYYLAGKVGHNSWHPNVALQVRTDIRNHYDFDSRTYTGLRADLCLRVWGVLPHDQMH